MNWIFKYSLAFVVVLPILSIFYGNKVTKEITTSYLSAGYANYTEIASNSNAEIGTLSAAGGDILGKILGDDDNDEDTDIDNGREKKTQGINNVETKEQPITTTIAISTDDGESKQENNGIVCTTNHVYVKDRVLAKNITHNPNRPIPRVVHFFVKSKCLPQDAVDNIMQWMSLENHSIFLHDHYDITEYLSKERTDLLAFVPNAFKCAFQHETILDLARLVWLYDYGGISVDIDHVPGAGFLGGALLDTTSEDKSAHHFVVEDSNSHPYPRFIATAPRHYANYGSIIISVAAQYRQHTFNATTWYSYTSLRDDIYRHTLEEFHGRDWNTPITTRSNKGVATIGIVNTGRTAGMMLLQVNITQESIKSIKFSNKNIAQCVDLANDSYQIDSKALLQVTEGTVDEETTCPDEQRYMSNKFIPESINIAGRKIPKIVHMTSKSKCFVKSFADNADLWNFKDHSFFMHDDKAVKRLFDSRKWPEFPLLKEVLPCLSSGAMKADYWRYLAIWEYGGIYTDMDNAPGFSFNNGTVIADEDDAFFEVEREKFPSQYFFAASPHHPVSYFMVAVTIERLIYMMLDIYKTNQTPQMTGPGATKMAVVGHMGQFYPEAGTYTGVYNRTLTMVGNPRTARKGTYCRRSAVASGTELSKMNMTHYLGDIKNTAMPRHSCRYEIMEKSKADHKKL